MLDLKLAKLPFHLKIAVNGAFKAKQGMTVVGDIIKTAVKDGGDYDEMVNTLSKVKSIKDFTSNFEKLAMKWEEMALMTPDPEAAKDMYLKASTYYSIAANFPFIESWEERKRLYERYRTCYIDALRGYSDWFWERIDIPFDDKVIPAIFTKLKSQEKPPVVLFLHGLWGSKEGHHWVVKTLIEKGYAVLRIDLPGHGESKYPLSLDINKTIKATIDYLKSRNDIDIDRIGIMGISLGGYTVLKSGDDERLTTIVDIAGFYAFSQEEIKKINAILKRMMLSVTGISEKKLMELSGQLTLSGVIKKIKCPVLIIHGEKDNIVPVSHAQRIYDELQCEKQIHIFPEEGHNFVGKQDELVEIVIDWLDKKLGRES